jgi:hypothetical protein
MVALFSCFQAALAAHHLQVQGITTDGSPLFPQAIQAIFGPVRHQCCEFGIMKDLNQAIVRALAQVRKQLAVQ